MRITETYDRLQMLKVFSPMPQNTNFTFIQSLAKTHSVYSLNNLQAASKCLKGFAQTQTQAVCAVFDAQFVAKRIVVIIFRLAYPAQ